MICIICGSEKFTIHDGIFYCTECSTQIEETRDEQTDDVSFCRKTLLSSPGAKKTQLKKLNTFSDWITAEAYNYIIFMQVNALIKLGASPKLKNTVLCIWTKYLQKCEIAFRKDYKADEKKPRLGPAPAKRDVKVLYGDKLVSDRKRKASNVKTKAKIDFSLDETVVSEGEENSLTDGVTSDSDSSVSSFPKSKPKFSSHTNKLYRKRKLNRKNWTSYSNKVFHMNIKKTLSFCYLGLLYTEDQLGLSDLIRFTNEQRIPFTNVGDKLPSYLNLQYADISMFLGYAVPDVLAVHKTAMEIIKFLKLPEYKIPSFHLAVSRLLKDLNLPDDLKPMIKILFEDFNCKKMKYSKLASENIPVDLLAPSFIVVVLKMLFILDGKFEIDHSKVMMKLNAIHPEMNYFVWSEWRQQAMLREYLFLVENPGYYFINKFDSLNADRMILKYPYSQLKPPSNEEALDCRSIKVSKHEIKTILTKMISLPTPVEIPSSSFPIKSAISHFEKEWRNMPMFRETKEMDFSSLKRDFTSCSLSYNPLQIDVDELSYLLMTSLYLPTSPDSPNDQLAAPFDRCDTIATPVKYWLFNTYKHKFDAGLVSGDWEKNLPTTFRWLISLFSKYSFVGLLDLYFQIVQIEKLIFLNKKTLSLKIS